MNRDAVNRKITEQFIADNPFDIVLHRKTKVAQPSGGWKLSDPEDLPAQRFTLVTNGSESPSITTDDGIVVIPTHTLVGEIDCDLKRHDTFEIDDRKYAVLQVSESRRDWARRGACVERTDGNR